MSLRVYPVKVKDEETKKDEDRIGLDVEDLVDEMIGLELGNPNVLENWFSLKTRLIELLNAKVEEEEKGKEKEEEGKPMAIEETEQEG